MLLNPSWVLFWDHFMTVLLFSTDVKWWSQEAFGYCLYCLGFSRRSRGDGWTRPAAEGSFRMRGGCSKRYCRSAAAAATALVSIFVCVQAFCTVKRENKQGHISLRICTKHLLRRSVKKQWLWKDCEAQALTLLAYIAVVLGGKLCIWLLWRCNLCTPKTS